MSHWVVQSQSHSECGKYSTCASQHYTLCSILKPQKSFDCGFVFQPSMLLVFSQTQESTMITQTVIRSTILLDEAD